MIISIATLESRYFHYDIVIVLKGLNINVCEELDPSECEAKACAWAGLSWFHIEIEGVC